MYAPFDEMKDSSRLWVYQCSRFLKDDEADFLSNSIKQFLDDWKAHGQPLSCSFLLRENIFLILAVDEDAYNASGCSIDASVHELQTLQLKLGVDFFGRDFVVFKKAEDLIRVRLPELKNKIANGEIGPETLVFNSLVSKKSKLNSDWLVPAGTTWLTRYFKTVNT